MYRQKPISLVQIYLLSSDIEVLFCRPYLNGSIFYSFYVLYRIVLLESGYIYIPLSGYPLNWNWRRVNFPTGLFVNLLLITVRLALIEQIPGKFKLRPKFSLVFKYLPRKLMILLAAFLR